MSFQTVAPVVYYTRLADSEDGLVQVLTVVEVDRLSRRNGKYPIVWSESGIGAPSFQNFTVYADNLDIRDVLHAKIKVEDDGTVHGLSLYGSPKVRREFSKTIWSGIE